MPEINLHVGPRIDPNHEGKSAMPCTRALQKAKIGENIMSSPKPEQKLTSRRLVYIDLAYTLKILTARQHEDYWLARHSWGYFEFVWGVHPFADVPNKSARRRISIRRSSPRQVSIEGTSTAMKLPKWLSPVNFLLSQFILLRSLVRSAAKHPVDAVFANDPLYAGLFGLLLARRLKVPLIVFVPAHFDELYETTGLLGFPRLFRFRKIEKAVMGLIFRNSEMVFAPADNVADMARRYDARPESVVRLSHGKYIASFHHSEPSQRRTPEHVIVHYGIPRTHRYLIFVGRHISAKRPEDVLRAMKYVFDNEPESIGIMAGVGELTQELRALAVELGISNRVVFPGLIDQRSLSLLLPHCICLSPITGMALIEASLGGAAVVAYDIDWQPEFVQSGTSGIIVPYRDWTSMGKAALDIIRCPERRTRLAAAGRARALEFVKVEANRMKEHAAFDAMFKRWRDRR